MLFRMCHSANISANIVVIIVTHLEQTVIISNNLGVLCYVVTDFILLVSWMILYSAANKLLSKLLC